MESLSGAVLDGLTRRGGSRYDSLALAVDMDPRPRRPQPHRSLRPLGVHPDLRGEPRRHRSHGGRLRRGHPDPFQEARRGPVMTIETDTPASVAEEHPEDAGQLTAKLRRA